MILEIFYKEGLVNKKEGGLNLQDITSYIANYRTRTKFCGINFHVLAGSEFRGSIFLCGVIFVDTRCSRSEINFQLRSYTRNVKFN